MDDFNNFFDDHEEYTSPRTPIYHTPDPPHRGSKTNLALIISIIIAVIMTLVVIVNVIILATLKDSIAKEYAEFVARQAYDQYSNAIQDALDDTDIIDDIIDNATKDALNALNSSVGEMAFSKKSSVARIDMFGKDVAATATAFLITDADASNPERYLITNAHCAMYAANTSLTRYEWKTYSRIRAIFDGDPTAYELSIVAVGGYYDKNLTTPYNNQPDLALLKVVGTQPSNEEHPSLQIASSDYSKPGTPIALIGNPEGVGTSNSISTGCISQTGIDMQDDWGPGTFILTDAALNSGNSGGPMLDRMGVVVGVAESKLVEESIDNMGFALSASTLRAFINWACGANNNLTKKTLFINCRYI